MALYVDGTEMTVPPDWTASGAGTIHPNNYTDNNTQLSDATVRGLFSGAGATSYNNSTGVITSTDTNTDTDTNYFSRSEAGSWSTNSVECGNTTRTIYINKNGGNSWHWVAGIIMISTRRWGSNEGLRGCALIRHWSGQFKPSNNSQYVSYHDSVNNCRSYGGSGFSFGGMSAGSGRIQFNMTSSSNTVMAINLWSFGPDGSTAGCSGNPNMTVSWS